MKTFSVGACVLGALLVMTLTAQSQQMFKPPDVKSLKHVTSRSADRAPDIPGNETTMEYYSAPDGTIVTFYSFRGRTVAFSTHSNSDIQGTYRVFLDNAGNGFFQELPKGTQWQLPAWSR